MIKQFKKGKYILIHERGINPCGFEIDTFDLFDSEKRIHSFFLGYVKVSDQGKDFPIGKIPYKYTKADYEKMLDKEVARRLCL